jgi:hypothetical protein
MLFCTTLSRGAWPDRGWETHPDGLADFAGHSLRAVQRRYHRSPSRTCTYRFGDGCPMIFGAENLALLCKLKPLKFQELICGKKGNSNLCGLIN